MLQQNQLEAARKGDINAFNELFKVFGPALRSYLYRLLTNRQDVEDYYHETFIKSFDKLDTFRGDQIQLKGWVFTIATRLSLNYLKRQGRWNSNAQDICRESLVNDVAEQRRFVAKVHQSENNNYEIKEHIDFCFTCINKTLSIEKQIALMLKEVYDFKVKEVAIIIDKTHGQVKHLLSHARKEMSTIFSGRCALISKNGTCHQCSELQGIFNPQRNATREVNKLQMVKDAADSTKDHLFHLRKELIKGIDSADNKGADLHDLLMQHLKKVNRLA